MGARIGKKFNSSNLDFWQMTPKGHYITKLFSDANLVKEFWNWFIVFIVNCLEEQNKTALEEGRSYSSKAAKDR